MKVQSNRTTYTRCGKLR